MNYKKHYNKLIERAKTRTLPPETYAERHHIEPRCIGGSEDDSNLVLLTPEEHYVAHQLLVKIYPKKSKLIYAANMMCMKGSTKRANRQYGWLKRKMSLDRKGKPISEEHKRKIGEAQRGKTLSKTHKEKFTFRGHQHTQASKQKIRDKTMGRIMTDETKSKISKANKGKAVSDETKQKISLAHQGKEFTKEHCQNIAKAKSGIALSEKHKRKISEGQRNCVKVYKRITCPHCGKEGIIANMKRWHFNNCKLKVINSK